MSSVVAVRHWVEPRVSRWFPVAEFHDAAAGWRYAKSLMTDPNCTAFQVCNFTLDEEPYRALFAHHAAE